jgi:mannose/cellobiose epimerase-like protein (N-acyl-D-glucosamine 2-epimerase family)
VVINAVLADGSIHDPVARLWAQSERIGAYLAHRLTDDEIAGAVRGLRRFLATPAPGLWFDQLRAGDVFISEPARATITSLARSRNCPPQFLAPEAASVSGKGAVRNADNQANGHS